MDSLTALHDCVAQALHRAGPVSSEIVPLSDALGCVLAEALGFAGDTPPVAEALRAGFAVTALDLTGASAGVPIPLATAAGVLPGDPLPPGADAVLPPDGVEANAAGWDAIRPVGPGEGVRRAGHDGRAGALIAPAGMRLTARHSLAASLAGQAKCAVRRPRVAIALPDPAQAGFARATMTALGARIVDTAPHLILRPAADAKPRLALAPAETAWLGYEDASLVLSVPHRFDAMVAACLALGVPAMAALTGAAPQAEERALMRKVASTLGRADLVLLIRQGADWQPCPAGTITLAGLAAADAFAILQPDSEGLPAGASLAGISLSSPFGQAP
jgi:molybdopterin biosynthesis enzyme